MPVQTYVSTLAKRLGQKVVAAHNENKDKRLQLDDFRELPPDVKNGIAQLSSCAIGVHGQDVKSEHLRGQEYFQAFGIAKSPKQTPKGAVEGLRTRFNVELTDEPAVGKKKAKSFSENWAKFQGFFERFGIDPPKGPQYDNPATGADAIMAYYIAAAKSLAQRKPHFGFETYEWSPPDAAKDAKPMLFEKWHKECEWNGQADPGAGVTLAGSNGDATSLQPEPFTEPPVGVPQGTDPIADPADIVVALVEQIMAEPKRLTDTVPPDVMAAINSLTDAAREAGITAGIAPETVEEMIAGASDYDVVGQMALGDFSAAIAEAPAAPATPTVGHKVKFCKRDSKGEKLKDAKKVPFPAQEYEVATVDAAAKTVTLKSKDGKPVVDLKKNIIAVKFEWLE